MNWNHRIVRTPAGDLSFKEVHYRDDGSPAGYTDIFTFAETVADLATLAYRLRMACKEPVLIPEDFLDADELADALGCQHEWGVEGHTMDICTVCGEVR